MSEHQETWQYKHFTICWYKATAKTSAFVVRCRLGRGADPTLGSSLGEVKWYGSWRQYCFFPESDTVWNATCLKDIQAFLDEQNAAHKTGIAKKGVKS